MKFAILSRRNMKGEIMGTYDTRGGTPISPEIHEPWIPETREEAEETIVNLLRQAKSGELDELEFERVAGQIFEWFSEDFNADNAPRRGGN